MNLTISEINTVINESKRLNTIYEQEVENIRKAHREEIMNLQARYYRQLHGLTEIHHLVEDSRNQMYAEHLQMLERKAMKRNTIFYDFKESVVFVWACIYCAALKFGIAKPHHD